MERYKIYIQPTDIVYSETSDPLVAGFARARGCYVRCYDSRPMQDDQDAPMKIKWIARNVREREAA